MDKLEILHFEQLKNEVQAQYLKNHTPSAVEISKWKGIDIIYFQEDLRKIAKGNISEKTFYTYFKSPTISKIPRIDMLNLLSNYAGYTSWYDFKKNHLFANEILSETENPSETFIANEEKNLQEIEFTEKNKKTEVNSAEIETEVIDLQKNIIENQNINDFSSKKNEIIFSDKKAGLNFVKKYFWLLSSGILLLLVVILIFWQALFTTNYQFTFIDADRNTKIKDNIEIRILKENETPIRYIVNSKKDQDNDDVGVFRYPTQSKTLVMEVNSLFYKKDTIFRNLDPTRTNETIELEPDVYAQALYYYSTNDISKRSDELRKRRVELDRIISNNALIYQVFDNETYGVETLDKQKYIGLVMTPTTSLKNFKMIETKVSPQTKKIILIKFKIQPDENITQ